MNCYGVGTTTGQYVFPPKTSSNDIYGFAQKAILHSIFDKPSGIGPPGSIKMKHTSPQIQNIGYKL